MSFSFGKALVGALLGACCLIGLCGPVQAATPSFITPPQWQSLPQDDGTVMLLAPGVSSGPQATMVFVTPTQAAEGNFEQQVQKGLEELESQLGFTQGRVIDRRTLPAASGEMRMVTTAYGGAQINHVMMVLAQRSARGVDYVVLVAPDAQRFTQFAPAAMQVFNSVQASAGGVGSAGQATVAAPVQALPANNGPVGALQASAPPGWGTSARGGNTLFTSPRNAYSGNINQLEVLPAQPVGGDWRSTFLNIWGQQVRPRFGSRFSPLPLRMRLTSGLVVLFDFDPSQVVVNGDRLTPGLYVVTDGRTAIPIVAMLRDFNDIDKEMRAWLPTLRLGGGQRAPALYAQGEVTGTWRSSSSSMASYVDASGRYVGDASVASGETLEIAANGQCSSAFAAIGGGIGRMRSKNTGQCRVNDDTLAVPSEQGPRGYRITGIGQSADGRRFMLLGITRDDYPFPTASSQQPRAGDVYVGQ